MNEQWKELKETIAELRDSDGTCTQQEVCKFLANYMDILEKQMQEPKTGHWMDNNNGIISCSYCHTWFNKDDRYSYMHYCPDCGAKMVKSQESEEEI